MKQASLLCCLVLAACYDPVYAPPGEVVENPTYETDIGPLFETTCDGCHLNGGYAEVNLDLNGGKASIVDIPSSVSGMDYVEPGDPEASYLYLKLADRQAEVGGSGSFMPIGTAFDETTLGNVETWILDGAL
jgi:hypothetical protein